MSSRNTRIAGWLGALAAALVLAACGGGGGGGGDEPAPLPVADARNGSYTLIAANAQEYTLSLDFDAGTYRVSGNGVDQGGSISGSGRAYAFLPSNSVGAGGTTTTRFSTGDDTIIGAVGIGGTVLPFIAPRSFVGSLADATGTFNVLGRTVMAGADPNNTINQAQITSDGHLRTCSDATIYEISACPAASLVTGTVTATGTQFLSHTDVGDFLFRVAKVGPDKVLLRASAASTTTARRLWIGTPATSSFASGSFAGGDTKGSWDTFTVNAAASTAAGTATTTAGVQSTLTGTVNPVGGGATLNSLLFMTGSDGGGYFLVRAADFAAVFAARGSTVAPGFVAIGRTQ